MSRLGSLMADAGEYTGDQGIEEIADWGAEEIDRMKRDLDAYRECVIAYEASEAAYKMTIKQQAEEIRRLREELAVITRDNEVIDSTIYHSAVLTADFATANEEIRRLRVELEDLCNGCDIESSLATACEEIRRLREELTVIAHAYDIVGLAQVDELIEIARAALEVKP